MQIGVIIKFHEYDLTIEYLRLAKNIFIEHYILMDWPGERPPAREEFISPNVFIDSLIEDVAQSEILNIRNRQWIVAYVEWSMVKDIITPIVNIVSYSD